MTGPTGASDLPFRRLPSTDRVLSSPSLQDAIARHSREAIVAIVRSVLQEARGGISRGVAAPSLEAVLRSVEASAAQSFQLPLKAVINATGVIIHTNLGRAPLSLDALEAVRQAAQGYSNLEMDLDAGERGSRYTLVERFVCQVTGAQAAIAVNNNAAAVLLGLTALAQGKEVIVSRGEAVEIGGGFRIPDVLRQSGATLVEVGTTNRTYARDFNQAITERTGALLRVHTSNFRVSGFVHTPTIQEMVVSARTASVPLLHDIGSGCLLDSRVYGLAEEPRPQDSLAAGADLVFFSGDKLLGGPQAGIIAGKKQYVEALQRHPLARAVRLDKMTLAALAATLLHYVKGEAPQKVPVWQMISAPLADLDRRAKRWARAVGPKARVVDGLSTIGGGSLPGEEIPSRVLAIPGEGQELEALAQRLRQGTPPVLARIEHQHLILDPRTVLPGEDAYLVAALRGAMLG